ncbi:hypothetical protein [Hydrogenivirga sp. 128-5-R1-1]|uniref:hypothetical protein n=1 Tax=Hydrogenivirga sp. 128-5-R1-1 TaxID=392423 RepID=UPI00015F3376|nr:hypothetical protein [Hydrogenivirga sp. 128-5-R1-1]EDP74812.1 hypothetical protein HG1285_13127 [Hydrogenivirga sp. 128-5-R1-1]
MKRVVAESARHFERIAEDLRGKDVVVEIRKIEDGEALYRATCKLFGIKPREIPEEEREKRRVFMDLLKQACRRHGLSLKDVPFRLYREGYLACRYGSLGDVVDTVCRIEDQLRKSFE